jgi:hypothetical protein
MIGNQDYPLPMIIKSTSFSSEHKLIQLPRGLVLPLVRWSNGADGVYRPRED